MAHLKIPRMDPGSILTANLNTVLDFGNHQIDFVISCNTDQTQKNS